MNNPDKKRIVTYLILIVFFLFELLSNFYYFSYFTSIIGTFCIVLLLLTRKNWNLTLYIRYTFALSFTLFLSQQTDWHNWPSFMVMRLYTLIILGLIYSDVKLAFYLKTGDYKTRVLLIKSFIIITGSTHVLSYWIAHNQSLARVFADQIHRYSWFMVIVRGILFEFHAKHYATIFVN